MKTIIQGKNLRTTYGVNYKWKTIKNDKGEDATVYTGKPELTKKTEIVDWKTIKEFDEEIEFNRKPEAYRYIFSVYNPIGTINLSDDDEIKITEKITRVDLGAYVLHSDKILHEEEVLKEYSEEVLEKQISAFNKMMITSNKKLLAYCKLHKLDPEETDVDELFKLIYPNNTYSIEDGKLVVNNELITQEMSQFNKWKSDIINEFSNVIIEGSKKR